MALRCYIVLLQTEEIIMSEKKVLAILGSPHKDGITAAMLDCATRRAEKMGYTVIKINLYEKNLSYCTGCRACTKTKVCVQKDDIREIVYGIHECQIVFLAAPVYWANIPAPVKNLFDRLLGTAMEETNTFPKPRLQGKKYLLLTSCNTPTPFSWIFGQSRGAIRNMDEFFRTAGMKSIGKIVCAGAANKKELPNQISKKIERCIK